MFWEFTIVKFLIEEGRQLPEKITIIQHTQTFWEKVKLGEGGRGEFRTPCGREMGVLLYTKRSINKIFICFLPLVNWTNLQCPEYANVIANKWLGWRGGNERVPSDKDWRLIPWQDGIYMEENLPSIFALKVSICLFERQGRARWSTNGCLQRQPNTLALILHSPGHFSWCSVLLRRGDLRFRSMCILMLFF